MQVIKAGGGWQAIWYVLRAGWRVGFLNLWRALSSRNACKTCALGMGGQKGGMVNEQGHWPEVCKKSVQAMVSDMQSGLSDAFFRDNSIDDLKLMSPRELEKAGRLSFPVIRAKGEKHFRRISWNDAFDRISQSLKQTAPERSFFYFSGRSSNEAAFLLQLFARSYGTNHVNNCSYYCHQASGVALNDSVGTGTATIRLEDLEAADLVFLIGANPSSNHPRLLTCLKKIRRRGGHVVVINPMVEPGLLNFKIPSDPLSMIFGSKIASDYCQVRIGGDIALLDGIAKLLMERGACDEAFIAAATEGYEDYKAYVSQLNWSDIESSSGCDKAQIEHLCDRYQAAKNVVFSWCMGITHHTHGVANIHTICNLAFMRGMVGRANAGLLPIRGHSNVQGIGSMAVTPELKSAVFKKLTDYGIKLPTMKGYDTMACMEAAQRSEIDFAYCLGGNLFGSNPDARYAEEAMSKIKTVVYLSTTLNTGHAWGNGEETLILPVYARDEEAQPTTQESMFNFVRLSDGGKVRHKDLRTEVDITTEVAHRVLGSEGIINWQKMKDHEAIRQMIAAIIPGYEQLKDIGKNKQEFHIPGRILSTPKFNTPTGKGRFITHPLPQVSESGFTLMTIRSEGQFNTAVFEDYDLYRGQDRRDVVLMNDQDMEQLGLKVDDFVTVKSNTGTMSRLRARPFKIRQGNAAMYYPEANVLIPRYLDGASKTPAFKATTVDIVKSR